MSDSPVPSGVPDKKLSIVEKVGYAFGDTASCLYFNTWAQFLLFFYTDVFGISAAAAGLMLVITRFGDVLVDPVVGVIADRTKTRHGKFRPWLRWMSIPLAIAAVLMFTTPNFSGNGKLFYAYITYSLALVAYSAINIPYSALMGVITKNPVERTELSSYRFLGAFSANLIVQYSLLKMVHGLGGGSQQHGFQLSMGIYGIAATLLFLTTFYTTKERVEPPKAQRNNLKTDLKELGGNGPWLSLCGIGVLTLVWVSIRGGSVVYYFKYYVGNEDMTSLFLTTGTVGTLVGVYCTKWIEKFLGGKRTTFMVCNVLSGVTLLWFFFLTPDQKTSMYVLNVLSSFIGGPLMPLTWSMFADTADYAEWKFNRRSTGLIFSAGTFSQKMGWSVGGGLAGILLSHYGFAANAVQSTGAQNGIRILMSLIPGICCFVTAAAVLFYKIDNKMLKQMGEDLRERRARDLNSGAAIAETV